MSKGGSIFNQMFDNTKSIYKSIASNGVLGDIHEFFDTGSYKFNAFISGNTRGGYPGGKITALAGEKGVGKTFLIMQGIKEFLDKHPTGACFFYESESAITKDMMTGRGIDVSRVFFFPVSTVEDWRVQQVQHLEAYNTDNYNQKQAHDKRMVDFERENKKAEKHNATKAVKDGKKEKMPIKKITDYKTKNPLMMVLDSIGNLSSKKEMENALEGKDTQVMNLQKIIKGTCRLITQMLSPYQVPMVMSSHVYLKMDGKGAMVMSGGSGPMFTASIIVFMRKSPIYDEKSKTYLGNIVRCQLEKGRLTKEKSKCEIQIMFTTGLCKYYGLVKPGVESGVIEQGGAWFTFPNGVKVQGEASIYTKDPEKTFDSEYLDFVDTWAQENYCYGSDTELYDDIQLESLEEVIVGENLPEVPEETINNI